MASVLLLSALALLRRGRYERAAWITSATLIGAVVAVILSSGISNSRALFIALTLQIVFLGSSGGARGSS